MVGSYKNISVKLSILITLFIVISLSGCFSNWQGDLAKIVISFGGADRVIYNYTDSPTHQLLNHNIVFSNNKETVTFKHTGTGTFESFVAPDNWTVWVYSWLGDEVYAAGTTVEKEVNLQAGKDNLIKIVMHEAFLVTFNPNEGSAVPYQVVRKSDFAKEPTPPTRTGYSFGGWYKDSNLTTPFNFNTEKIYQKTNIFAKWGISIKWWWAWDSTDKDNNYKSKTEATITPNSNNSGGNVTVTGSIANDQDHNWASQVGCDYNATVGKKYKVTWKWNTTNNKPFNNVTIRYAQQLDYQNDSKYQLGTDIDKMTIPIKEESKTYEFTMPDNCYMNFTFMVGADTGYFIIRDFKIEEVKNASSSYTVTFNINGGTGTTPTAQTVTSGSSITLPSGNGLTKAGYTFDGWNTNANGMGQNYTNTYTPTGNITLYAKWKIYIEPEGSTLNEKLDWIYMNAVEGGNYIVKVTGTQTINGQRYLNSKSDVSYKVTITGGATVNFNAKDYDTRTWFNVSSKVKLTLEDITLIGSSNNYRPMVAVNGELVMNNNAKITGNTTNIYESDEGKGIAAGGVVVLGGGTFTMNGGTISENTYKSGGGVAVLGGTFTMKGGEISGNIATDGNGGGVYVSNNGTFTKSGGTIYGYSQSEPKSNKVQASSGIQDKKGHAVYVDSNPARRRERTAGSNDNLDSKVSGPSGGWEIEIEMVNIPGGSFEMGYEDVVHTVTLSSFYMGKYEVTQEQWKAVMGNNPSYFTSLPASGEVQQKRPVENVSWYDTLVFCNKLSMMEGLSSAYSISGSTDPAVWGTVPTSDNSIWDAVQIVAGSTGYRLPTEAQWEYAARGGNGSLGNYTYSGSNTIGNVAWYESNSGDKTHEVGKKSPNGLGLYDMSGNVFEWCWDWFGGYPSGEQTDPGGADSGFVGHVLRGGCWNYSAEYTYCNSRSFNYPYSRSSYHGFRLVRPIS